MVSIYPRSCLIIFFTVISLSISIATSAAQDTQKSSLNGQLTKEETSQFLARLVEVRKQAGDSEVSFREKRIFPFMNQPVESTGTLAFHPPNSFRRNVNQGSLTISNGKTLWIYDPALQQLEIYDLAQIPSLRDALTAMTAALSADQLPTLFTCTLYRNNNGNTTLSLIPRTAAVRKVASKVILVLRPNLSAAQLEIYSPQGDQTLTTFGQESHTRFSPETFEFRPPPGTRISRPLAN